jgi:hypothetical protein
VDCKKLEGKNIICVSKNELKDLFEVAGKKFLLEQISKQGYALDDFRDNKAKMLEFVKNIELVRNKEDHEIFSVLYVFSDFYEKDCEICFELRRGVSLDLSINNLSGLKRACEESTLNDFIIITSDGARLFQLKRYRGILQTDDLFKFLKEELSHYGNNLGKTNLLVMLESKNGDLSGVDFHKINKKLLELDLRNTDSEILISYNEENKFYVINRVFPTLARSQRNIILPSGLTVEDYMEL